MMRPAGISAPKKALETIPSSPATPANDTPTMMAVTAPKHAPEDMPVLYGSARGLPMRACIRVPHTAREAPARMAATTWGIAVFQM